MVSTSLASEGTSGEVGAAADLVPAVAFPAGCWDKPADPLCRTARKADAGALVKP